MNILLKKKCTCCLASFRCANDARQRVADSLTAFLESSSLLHRGSTHFSSISFILPSSKKLMEAKLEAASSRI